MRHRSFFNPRIPLHGIPKATGVEHSQVGDQHHNEDSGKIERERGDTQGLVPALFPLRRSLLKWIT